MDYNFQTESKKIKLLKEYERVTQRVLLGLELILQTAEKLQHGRLSWQVSSFVLLFPV
jgi:hypothetical protein